jgi:hypothetical protein
MWGILFRAGLAAEPPQGIMQAQAPDDVWGWLLWHLKPLVAELLTLNTLLVAVALAAGLAAAIGATEASKRFAKLFEGPNWALRAQLYAAVWGAFVTTVLIWVMTDWPAKGQVAAIIAVAPLAAFYPHRAYDWLRDRFPNAMGRALGSLRGPHNVDATPP